jgi:hypothetical protein
VFNAHRIEDFRKVQAFKNCKKVNDKMSNLLQIVVVEKDEGVPCCTGLTNPEGEVLDLT